MSQENRKIGLYTIQVLNMETEKYESPRIISNLVKKLVTISLKDRISEVSGKNKAHYLAEYFTNGVIDKLIFKSAKHHHRPPLIDIETAIERENPKALSEAEAEATHICIGYASDIAVVVCENRLVGISINQVSNYLEEFYKIVYPKSNNYSFIVTPIVNMGFMEALKKAKRVSMANVTKTLKSKKVRDEIYDLTGRKNHDELSEDIQLVLKAKRGFNIAGYVMDLVRKMSRQNSEITKIQVKATNEDGAAVVFDTDVIRAIERIDVILNADTGTVNYLDIFDKMESVVKLQLKNY